MKKWYLFPALLLLIVLANSCKKEYSQETGLIQAEGSLQSDVTGDCLPKTVAGSFEVGTLLDETNYIEISIDITVPGAYSITTDTLNGMYFSAVGRFSTIGLTTLKLQATGTPLAEGTDNFEITFSGTSCTVQVITLPEGSGGPAEFTLDGAPGVCTSPIVNGVYSTGEPLGNSNTIEFHVNVTTLGTYSITTTEVNGITFSGTGTLGSFGPATITLIGTGTPEASGPTEFAVPGTTSCTYNINVVGPAEFTIDCDQTQVLGTYGTGVALDAGNEVRLVVDVAVPGAYNISGTVNGMRFELTGEFLVAADGIGISLPGSGTPEDAGDYQLVLTGGIDPCEATISVTGTVAPDWEFTENGVTYSGSEYQVTRNFDQASGFTVIEYDGENADGDELYFQLIDVGGDINNNETYVTDVITGTSNLAFFQFDAAGGAFSFNANPSLDPPPKLTIKVITNDAPNGFIEGTFSGVVQDENGTNHTLTNGKFKGTY